MKLPNSVHTSQPWRIQDIASDFRLLDVWALPVQGTAAEFDDLLAMMAAADPANTRSLPARFLWRARDLLGRLFDLGSISTPVDGGPDTRVGWREIPGTDEISLAERLPEDLRHSAGDLDFKALPFVPLYRTDVEFAAEVSNRTVHGVLHLAWVKQNDGSFQGQLAVYVKPRGRLGEYYLKLIEPFRQLIVYPALMRQSERTWAARSSVHA